jgi:hypothetical protein
MDLPHLGQGQCIQPFRCASRTKQGDGLTSEMGPHKVAPIDATFVIEAATKNSCEQFSNRVDFAPAFLIQIRTGKLKVARNGEVVFLSVWWRLKKSFNSVAILVV